MKENRGNNITTMETIINTTAVKMDNKFTTTMEAITTTPAEAELHKATRRSRMEDWQEGR